MKRRWRRARQKRSHPSPTPLPETGATSTPIGLFETTLIDPWPLHLREKHLPREGTWSLHSVCSSGESDELPTKWFIDILTEGHGDIGGASALIAISRTPN